MASLVLTVIGDDRSGLVEALSRVVADHHGNWERSRMAELAGKFAGIVLVTVPDEHEAALVADLGPLADRGLLDVSVALAGDRGDGRSVSCALHLLGTDQPGIVAQISAALAAQGVSIAELSTETREAPMAGGMLFEATAMLEVPDRVASADLRASLEDVAAALMVDIEID